MPAKKIFSVESPKVSIIIPSLDGNRDGNVEKLIGQIKNQSFKSIEIILSINEKPNGHARNIGSELISEDSQVVCFFDDDVNLGSNKIIEYFLKVLEIKEIGLVGASQIPPKESSLFQKWISYDLNKASIGIKNKITDSEMVTHAGLACRVKVWKEMNGEDSNLLTGTDTDLRHRLREKGYRVVLVPNTFVYHPLPHNIMMIFRNAKFHGVYQYDYRKKHGFQKNFYSPFIKIKNNKILILVILRELLIFFPHIFISKRSFFIGFRPINAIFRFIMVFNYAVTCQEKLNSND